MKLKDIKSKKTSHIKLPQLPPNYNLNKPIFSFYNMQYGDCCCISRCSKEEKSSITNTLIRLSQLTWQQISSQPREKLGYEKIPQEKFSIPFSHITPEVDIKVFRHSEKGRIAGYRVNDIYHIVAVGDALYKH